MSETSDGNADAKSDGTERETSDMGSLEALFAREAQARVARSGNERFNNDERSTQSGSDERFTGIKEILLDVEGRPYAATPAQVEPPSLESQLWERISWPGVALGSVISVASLALLLAIAAADSSA
eukprot:CAMPEP_0183333020 /NCGR_PEP_ID=MMETSP0164_2-20130417/2033_1 /TAXON_ID=221442 /ORGANISM="Coccolithus pelagicus ssp braarudi, Strain PLY182g" /LENGTH=125 /DNA_ID=CAMNT_0025501845 /DNA_START=212 /DNA_END=589 /DNA_ORIENTATION=-